MQNSLQNHSWGSHTQFFKTPKSNTPPENPSPNFSLNQLQIVPSTLHSNVTQSNNPPTSLILISHPSIIIFYLHCPFHPNFAKPIRHRIQYGILQLMLLVHLEIVKFGEFGVYFGEFLPQQTREKNDDNNGTSLCACVSLWWFVFCLFPCPNCPYSRWAGE